MFHSVLRTFWVFLLLSLSTPHVTAQSSYGNDYYDYSGDSSQQQQQQDYSQDSLYHDYAARQYDKEVG